MGKELTNPESFKISLDNLGVDFTCETPLPAISASITFLGPFSGETVVWNLTLAVIKSGEKPYIEIQQGSSRVYPLRVGLALPVIDEPVIKKTIIMMRNYKRLAIGRIEFGSMHT